ncbi:MAG: glycosyltransferase [Elusimicrobia bacterium]|nr:glycosyltransferase [Elusimicrobiota bacterium]
MSGPALRLVILAYNEGRSLEGLFARLEPAWKVFVVDDGSTDDTAGVLARVMAKGRVFTLKRHPVNRGLAAAFLTGLRAAVEGAGDDEVVAVLEGDGTSDPALLPAMAAALTPPCDVVIASRHVPGGGYRRFPFQRHCLSVAANAVLRAVCGLPGVRDYSIFYRLYRVGPLKAALAEHGDALTSVGGFASNAEILLRLAPFVREFREVPFVYDYGVKPGASSLRPAGELPRYLRLLLRVWRG